MKSKKKKRSSLKFGSIFCPKLGEEQKKKVFTQIWSNFLPKLGCKPKTNVQSRPIVSSKLLPHLQRRGPCRNFAYYSMLYYPGDPKGGDMAQWPPLNIPLCRASLSNHFCWKEVKAIIRKDLASK